MTSATPDLSVLRNQFPALQQTDEQGRPFVYFDGPGGTQVPRSVIDVMADYLTRANANTHGAFTTSQRSDQIIAEARQAGESGGIDALARLGRAAPEGSPAARAACSTASRRSFACADCTASMSRSIASWVPGPSPYCTPRSVKEAVE